MKLSFIIIIPLIKTLHISLVLITLISFVARMVLLQINPGMLKKKWLKILPHVIDTLLLLSGITLVIQGSWLAADYGWLIAKLTALIAYIGLGVIAMHRQGKSRWLAFFGAVGCYIYMFSVAITKNIIPW